MTSDNGGRSAQSTAGTVYSRVTRRIREMSRDALAELAGLLREVDITAMSEGQLRQHDHVCWLVSDELCARVTA